MRQQRSWRLGHPLCLQRRHLSRSVLLHPALLVPTVLQLDSYHLQLTTEGNIPKPDTREGSKGPDLVKGWGKGGTHLSRLPCSKRKRENPQLLPRSQSGLQQYYHSLALLLVIYFASHKQGLNYILQPPNLGHRPTEQDLREIR